MASSFEKSVKGATKPKLAPPKSKYIEHILVATHGGDHGVAEVFRHLQHRLRDSTWYIVFKALIVVHVLIREGVPDMALKYLATSPQRKLAINNFTEMQAQGRNIRTYDEYLVQRAVSYEATKVDSVRTANDGRLKRLNIEKGLLREVEAVQSQIKALVRCDFFSQEPENDITMFAFRMLISDLIALYFVMNEGTVNVIEHFLEMSKPDAERAVVIYKTFCKQTEKVVNYLSIARHYEHATRVEIPKMKHAPTNLINGMEEYLTDPDFEVHRRQYLAEQQNKKKGTTNGSSRPFTDSKASTASRAEPAPSFPDPKPSTITQASSTSRPLSKGPAPDLIDFFESIEQNQTPMAQTQYEQPQYQPPAQGLPPQATGFAGQNPFLVHNNMPQGQGMGMPAQATGFPVQQPFPSAGGQTTNPFLQMQQQQQQAPMMQQQPQPQIQPNYTGAGFGGYTPQPQQPTGFQPNLSSIPQSGMASFLPSNQQPQFTSSPIVSSPTQGSNPFRQAMLSQSATGTTISSLPSQPTASSMSSLPSSVSRQSTNPFARSSGTPPQGNPPFNTPAPFAGSQPSAFSPQPQGSFSQPQAQPLMPAQTGSNPFARNAPGPSTSPFSAPVATNPTGTSNPFRQSQFVNQATGQGWQNTPQGTLGGMSTEQVPTTYVFPRPAGQPQ